MDTPEIREALRGLPSLDALLRRPGLEDLVRAHGRDAVRDVARALLDELREGLRRGETAAASPGEVEAALRRRVEEGLAPSLRAVVNATGVVLHTNLGRAPLPEAARAALARTAGRYLNLELDLATGERGRRGERLEEHVRAVTGAEAALVVNNNAAAVLLVLNTLAEGRDVVVSRGELVEIGGSFRLPEIMARSGALLREVGTTNRTRLADYAGALGPETGLLLKVHTSNFRLQGFTEEVAVAELAGLGAERGVPVVYDVGSGVVVDPSRYALGDEPRVQDALAAGADLVTFSGDKALGGPQAGYLVGRREPVERCRRNPLHRAVRPGRLDLAAAEATWLEYRSGRHEGIPVLRMLSASEAEIRARAEALAERLRGVAGNLRVEVVRGEGRAGGGTAPEASLPSALLAVEAPGTEAGELAARLRAADPPVLARVREGRLLLDLRTVLPEEEEDLLRALGEAARA